MRHSLAVLLMALGLLWGFLGNGNAQTPVSPSSAKQHALCLNRANSGQHVAATISQPIQITLQTIGPGQYDSPQITSAAVRFERAAFPPAREQNPGGPTQVYYFRAASEGEAEVRIPHTASNPAFTVTIRIHGRRRP